MRRVQGIALLLTLGVLTGCNLGDRGMDSETVARAGDFRLSVDQVAEMLTPVSELPADDQVVQAIADFWGDYVLLAWLVNQEGELNRLDLSSVIRQQADQEMVLRLRDEVIQVDTEISDEELRAIFEEERPGDEVHARHILLLYPDDATQAQRDSVRGLAEDLRDRARGGADFAAMAEEYSDDTGSAARGGDLGFFGRGLMVPPFEEAAFALEPGEVSDVVESQFGLHVIKAEGRRSPTFEEVQEELRGDLEVDRTAQAESIYVAELEGRANIQVQDDAVELAREITRSPEDDLSGRAARRPLATYEGGAFTAGDFRGILLLQQPAIREQVLNAPDGQIADWLQDLTRSKVLVDEARSQGLELDPAEVEEMRGEIRQRYVEAAEHLGLQAIQPRDGETLRAAVEREVGELMARLLRGEGDVVPLEHFSVPLRNHYGFRVSDSAVQDAAERARAMRAEAGAPDAPPMEMPGTDPEEIVPPEPEPDR